MNRKIIICLLTTALLSIVPFVEAQQPGKVPRIGYLATSSPSSELGIEPFRQGLRDLGYVEEQNISIEYRFAEGKLDRLPDLAAELVRLKVNVIVTAGTVAAQAAKQATTTIPIVMGTGADPVGAGLIASLARPGGNITGLTTLSRDLGGKRLELLKDTVPGLSRVAVFGVRSTVEMQLQMKEIEAAARALGVQLQALEVRGPGDFDSAFQAASRGRANALIVLSAADLSAQRRRVVEDATKSRLPAMYPNSQYVEAGGLMSYGTSFPDLYRGAATYVDKILKGAKPADLPVQQPMKFELVINLKAAKQIGLTIPPNLLVRADRVIK